MGGGGFESAVTGAGGVTGVSRRAAFSIATFNSFCFWLYCSCSFSALASFASLLALASAMWMAFWLLIAAILTSCSSFAALTSLISSAALSACSWANSAEFYLHVLVSFT